MYYKLYEKDNRYILTQDRFMVKNNIEVDVKVKCIEQGKTQVKLAEEIDTTKAYVNRVIKKPDGVVNRTFKSYENRVDDSKCDVKDGSA